MLHQNKNGTPRQVTLTAGTRGDGKQLVDGYTLIRYSYSHEDYCLSSPGLLLKLLKSYTAQVFGINNPGRCY